MMPDAKKILDAAQERIRQRVIQAHKDEGVKKNGEGKTFQQPAALGFYAAKALAEDCYTMGMMDALEAIEEVRGANQ